MFRRFLRPAIYITTAIAATIALGCCFLWRDDRPRTLTAVTTLTNSDTAIGEPFGIAVRDSEVYVSDGAAGRILKLGPDGAVTIVASGLSTPSGLAFLPDGELVVADTGSHTIKNVSPGGSVTIIAGIENVAGSGDGAANSATFNGPTGVAADDNGNVFVADTYNDRIRVIERHGVVATVSGSSRGFADGDRSNAKFDTPLGLVRWQDKLLVADSGSRRIRVVEPNGDVFTLAGTGEDDVRDGTLASSAFVSPTAIAVDQAGQIFIADGNAIRAIGRRAFPFVETVAGERRGYADGAASRAGFNRPSGLAIGTGGEILIADSDNHVIRAISDGGIGRAAGRDEIESRRMTPEAFRSLQPARWPFDPPLNPREVAGTLGEIRGEISGENKPTWFHNGLDIAGAYGEATKFIRTETVLDPHSAQNFGTSRELLRMPMLGYIHLRLGRDKNDDRFGDARFQFEYDAAGKPSGLRIRRGTRFEAGDLIGTLNAMNHVHLIAGRSGREINALAAINFPGIGDSIPPVIEDVSLFNADWQKLEPDSGGRIKLAERTRVAVRAYDRMNGNSERRRLGVYRIGYHMVPNGSPVSEIDWTIKFDRMPVNEAVRFAYANGSRSGYTSDTIFSYIATNRIDGDSFGEGFLDTPTLATGSYTLRVFAADFFGNTTTRDVRVVR